MKRLAAARKQRFFGVLIEIFAREPVPAAPDQIVFSSEFFKDSDNIA